MGSKINEGFEVLYRELESTIAKLEEGNLTLEESISLYEGGMKLAQKCRELLQDADLRITRLQEAFSGDPVIREDAPEYTSAAGPNEPEDEPLTE